MAKILVSSCLLGFKVRYNGSCMQAGNNDLKTLIRHHEIIPFCPETEAGLPTPRDSSEIISGDGSDVVTGAARVMTEKGEDVTWYFLSGAEKALDKCRKEKIMYAVLSERSPSCGSSLIYDGSFSGVKKAGRGVTAALLEKEGIKVCSQFNIESLLSDLQ